MLSNKVKAPPFSPGLPWINVSEPLTLEMLKGKIVLLDFWTFCCADCMHILPYLKKLEKQFEEYLVVIGVHTAKFDNEGKAENIKRAVMRYGIEHPVICDRGYSMWEKYFVREWPTLILIDPEGNIVERIACSQKPYGKFEIPIASLIQEYESSGELNSQSIPQIQIEADTQSNFLRFPGKVIADIQRNRIFISDTGHNRVLVAELDQNALNGSNGESINTRLIDTIGNGRVGSSDGAFDDVTMHNPQGLCLHNGKLLIADTDNHLIRLADLESRTLTTIAGNGKQWLYEAESNYVSGPFKWNAKEIALSSPWDLAADENQIFIAMAGSHHIWCLDLESNMIEIYAGTGRESLVDGERSMSQLSQPSALSIKDGVLYFVDSETSSVRCIDLKSGQVRTLIGEGLFAFGDKDGQGKSVLLQHPLGVVAYGDELLIADSYNHKIKSLQLAENSVTTISGNGKAGNAISPAQYSEPGGLCMFGENALIADTNNHRIIALNLHTKVASVVEIDSEVPSSAPSLPNMHIVEIGSKTLKKNASAKIKIDLNIMHPFHLNDELPLNIYLLESNGLSFTNPGEKSGTNNNAQCKSLAAGETEFEIRTLDQATSDKITKLAAVAYYCAEGENSACFVKSFVFELDLKLSDQSTDEPLVTLPLSI